MTATGLTLKYQAGYPGSSAWTTVALEALGASEGGSADLVTGTPTLDFRSHAASELTVRLPAVAPDTAAVIPFESPVQLLLNGSPIFQGRRVNRPGTAAAAGPFVDYCVQDLWYDLAHMTFKQAWFGGAYQAATFDGTTVAFASPQLGQSAQATQMLLYAASGGAPATPGTVVNIVSWTDASHAVVSGSFSGTVAYATLLYNYPDVVLFQYRPTDPYQSAGQVTQFYITTGDQIKEVLDFAAANGVAVQYDAAELAANCAVKVPWYPMRAAKCAEALRKCLAFHPDCTTEVDYTTTPPTFHVRTWQAGPKSLVPATLPYRSTAGGREHKATDIKPRPELVPSRVGIFYRYLVNGYVLAFPKDVWPANAPDGLRAMDYSLDLQGPRISQQLASIRSVAFDPTNSPAGMAWWLRKCRGLADPGVTALAMVSADGKTPGTSGLRVLDDNGNALDWAGTYRWELASGSVEFWFSGIASAVASVSTYFAYQGVGSNGELLDQTKAHPQTVRVKLVNTASVTEAFTQFLTTGEAIPSGLAQYLWTALQNLQYTLSHKLLEVPFSGAFLKPGLNSINLSGGAAEWASMGAVLQDSRYTLMADASGNVFADLALRCGPVETLEPAQYVQLFNLFANRDLIRIDPWERITGASAGASTASGGDTAVENAHPGAAGKLLTSHVSNTADANGFYTVVQTDARSSGIALFKWDGTSKAADGTPAPRTTQPSLLLDLSQIDLSVADPAQLVCKFQRTADANGKVIYVVATGVPAGGGSGSAPQQFKFIADFGDYVSAKSWDGTTLGTTLVYIWKPAKIRCSIAQELNVQTSLGAKTMNYTYSPLVVANVGQPFYTRSALSSDGTVSETQLATPDYLANDLIYAVPVPTGLTNLPPSSLAAAAVHAGAGGSGYSQNQIVVPTGGTAIGGNNANIKVLTVDGSGKILTAQVVNAGSYSSPPSPLAANPVSSNGGTGAMFDLTMTGVTMMETGEGREWAATSS